MITFITDRYTIDPLGIAYLSAMLKKAGHKVDLKLSAEVVKDYSQVVKSSILAYSVTTGKHKYYAELNQWLKGKYPAFISFFGGPHCTFFPDFAKEPGVDYICRGEGFGAIVDFAEAVITDKALNKDRKDKIPNIAYYDAGRKIIIQNELRPAVKVSGLPFPDRKLIYQYPQNRDNPIKNVMASFGCPMFCNYCYNKQYTKMGYEVRIRSVDSVVEECAQLVRDYPATELIFFQDDIFPINRPDWVRIFAREYRKRLKTKFHVQFRIEMLKESVLQNLKSAGLHGVTFAIETADEKTRYNLLNRKFDDEKIFAGVKLLRKYDVKFRTENMLGLPGETLSSALRTLDLNIECSPDIAWASLYQPYPGTDLGDYCRDNNLVDTVEYDVDFFTHSRLKLKQKKEIERLQKLFAFICAYPKLRPWAWQLCSLPFSYNWIYQRVKRYLYDNRLYAIQKGVEQCET